MLGLLKNNQLKHQNIFFISLCLMILSFPVSIAANSICIGLFLLLFFLDYRNLKANSLYFIQQKQNVLLIILFLSIVISLFQTENLGKGIDRVLHDSVMIILPLALTPIRRIDEKRFRLLEILHIAVCVLASVYCLVKGGLDSGLVNGTYINKSGQLSTQTYLVQQFTYHNLSAKVHLHAVYFSLFIGVAMFFSVKEYQRGAGIKAIFTFIFLAIILFLLTSVVIHFAFYSFLLFYFYFTLSFNKRRQYILFCVLSVLFSLAILYQFVLKYTSSYTNNVYLFEDAHLDRYFIIVPVVSFIVALSAAFFKPLFQKRRVFFCLVLVAISSVAMLILNYNYQRKNYVEREQGVGINNINARNGNWIGAWMVIKEHPITGVGIGDEVPELVKKYKEINFTTGVQNDFNSHNQYLEFWVSSGILAFLAFTFLIIYLIYHAYKTRNFSLLCLVYMFAVFCITESTMSRQPGRMFFLFFLCILIYGKLPGNENSNKLSTPA
jgi:O-antigen ligase